MNQQQAYIQNIPAEEALAAFLERLDLKRQSEVIATPDALGRITTEAVYALTSSPNSNQAAMDGIAVRANDTSTARITEPLDLVEGETFFWINTGNTLPSSTDAVIMIEEVVTIDQKTVRIHQAAVPWQHVRPIGEDIVETEMIVPSGHRLRPVDLAALLAGGIDRIEVAKTPEVGILPTGNEIVQDPKDLEVGTIRDTNSLMLKAILQEKGIASTITKVIRDERDSLKAAILERVKSSDLVLVIAGSSAGRHDHAVHVLRELGEVVVHGVALKPGKPVILAIVDQKPVIGIPGFPVSAYLTAQHFVLPVLAALTGEKTYTTASETAVAARRIASSVKSEEHVRVNLGRIGDKLVATRQAGGAGVLMSLVRADGIAVIPRETEGVDAGGILQVDLLKPRAEIAEKLFAVGSHDIVMDVLSDLMPVSSSHVGSQAGLLALKRREANFAPTHILDEESGIYNEPIVRRYFPEDDMVLIKVVERVQGIMVQKDNPKNIRTIKDLARDDVTFANRQRGAGTRILLDYLLGKEAIDPADIQGYDRALTTHLAVASAVATGSADAGLGILSAANALGLDFYPIGNEEYDFLMYEEALDDPRIQRLLELLKSDHFKQRVATLGGYGFSRTGEIVYIKKDEADT